MKPTARGNMGAGKSEKEGLGSEKPRDGPGLGTQQSATSQITR
jgi:hypothetical protein